MIHDEDHLEKIVISINDAETSGHSLKKKKKNLETNLTFFIKVNSKWIQTLM